jgi:hypothetical protein
MDQVEEDPVAEFLRRRAEMDAQRPPRPPQFPELRAGARAGSTRPGERAPSSGTATEQDGPPDIIA